MQVLCSRLTRPKSHTLKSIPGGTMKGTPGNNSVPADRARNLLNSFRLLPAWQERD